jgi:Domain of unknown function (DUF4214)
MHAGRCALPLLSLLLAVTSVAVLPRAAAAQSGETTLSFIQNAYHAVGVTPSCADLKSANDFIQTFPDGSAGRIPDAAFFVSTLFETSASWYSGPPTFVETSSYSSRNALTSGASSAFVTDLYNAFLQRTPDSGGLTYWTGRVDAYSDPAEGRSRTLGAFQYSSEFMSLVESLVSAGISCP